MKLKTIIKIIIDFLMTIGLLLLMAFELLGRAAHEWIGAGMFLLFIIHHILNRKWSKNLFNGRYTAYRVMQTILVISVFLTMMGSFISAIILSRHVFAFLPISGGRNFARILHLLSAYWGFVLMSLHIGLHWETMMGMVRRLVKRPSRIRNIFLRCLSALIIIYGMYAFTHREIGSYMMLKTTFVFFDFEEPLIWFYIDYIAIMGLFVALGYYLAKLLRRAS
ncbi:DUF4405 domain-containing protein [Lacrimispora sp.]|uniref:DUF4405 domain-containing protein n=1 Tax=Lacrimispora sp. TaxID=2719234 RepID=UPI00345FBD6C